MDRKAFLNKSAAAFTGAALVSSQAFAQPANHSNKILAAKAGKFTFA